MLQEKLTSTVISSLKETFQKTGWGQIDFSPSYWSKLNDCFDYRASVDFSGSVSGTICFSLSEDFVIELLKRFKMGTSKQHMSDIVYELANIVAGNLGKVLGDGFSISLPGEIQLELLQGKDLLHIPIKYKNAQGFLILDVFVHK